MKIITSSRIFLISPQSELLICTRPNCTALDIPTESVLTKFDFTMRQLQQNDELWRVDYLCMDYVTFELVVMQGSLTLDHLSNAVKMDNYLKIKFRFDSIGGCWEMRVVDNYKMQGIWGDRCLIVPIY